MVSFTVRTTYMSEDRAFIDEIMRPLTLASRQEQGCVNYVPHWLQGETATMLIYEQYVDQAALEAHRQTPHFEKYVRNGLDVKLLTREYVWLDAML